MDKKHVYCVFIADLFQNKKAGSSSVIHASFATGFCNRVKVMSQN